MRDLILSKKRKQAKMLQQAAIDLKAKINESDNAELAALYALHIDQTDVLRHAQAEGISQLLGRIEGTRFKHEKQNDAEQKSFHDALYEELQDIDDELMKEQSDLKAKRDVEDSKSFFYVHAQTKQLGTPSKCVESANNPVTPTNKSSNSKEATAQKSSNSSAKQVFGEKQKIALPLPHSSASHSTLSTQQRQPSTPLQTASASRPPGSNPISRQSTPYTPSRNPFQPSSLDNDRPSSKSKLQTSGSQKRLSSAQGSDVDVTPSKKQKSNQNSNVFSSSASARNSSKMLAKSGPFHGSPKDSPTPLSTYGIKQLNTPGFKVGYFLVPFSPEYNSDIETIDHIYSL